MRCIWYGGSNYKTLICICCSRFNGTLDRSPGNSGSPAPPRPPNFLDFSFCLACLTPGAVKTFNCTYLNLEGFSSFFLIGLESEGKDGGCRKGGRELLIPIAYLLRKAGVGGKGVFQFDSRREGDFHLCVRCCSLEIVLFKSKN